MDKDSRELVEKLEAARADVIGYFHERGMEIPEDGHLLAMIDWAYKYPKRRITKIQEQGDRYMLSWRKRDDTEASRQSGLLRALSRRDLRRATAQDKRLSQRRHA